MGSPEDIASVIPVVSRVERDGVGMRDRIDSCCMVSDGPLSVRVRGENFR